MASPSNRKDGSTYLDKFTKEQIIKRHLDLEAELMKLEEKHDKLISENAVLNKQFETVKRRYDKINTNEEIMKKILEYRARNYSPVIILEKLKLQGIENYDIKKVKDLINGELSAEMELFYSKCVEAVTESIRINTTYYKQSSIEELQRLIDSAYEDLDNSEVEDIKTRDSLRTSISNLISKRDNLMKNIDESKGLDEEDEVANEATQEWIKQSEDAVVNLAVLFSGEVKYDA